MKMPFISSQQHASALDFLAGLGLALGAALPAAAGSLANVPLFVGASAPPLVMLTMGRDHKLYYEAYNDASDLNGDGIVDTHYNPAIDYLGYFESYQCYVYDAANSVFKPSGAASTKKCSGSSDWSGDFLNYLTTARMDALRKVLYGGNRLVDTASSTVLERSYIPQDAHSWGKEYTGAAVDGYDIQDYTPLSLPSPGTRHLFANTTLVNTVSPATIGPPLLRVLTSSRYRVWEWVSIEQPVAGTDCATGNNVRSPCATAGGTVWEIVPAGYFSDLTQTTYNTTGYNNYPGSSGNYDSLESNYAIASKKFGSGPVSQINGSGNPFSSAAGSQDNYLTIFQGTLVIPAGEGGSYKFAVDGDDAVDLIIDGTVVAGWYGGHGNCGCTDHAGTINLSAGNHTLKFRHQEGGGGDNYYLRWQKTIPASAMTDMTVRVQVCNETPRAANCKAYVNGSTTTYKPTGLLHDYGENDSMMFGLLTGSYTKNTSGGVVRKNIKSFTDEVSATSGIFQPDSTTNGVVQTISKLRITGFGSASSFYTYSENCGWASAGGLMQEGMCRMWGNPIGEMMYEGLRYFAGKATPTPAYSSGVNGTGTDDTKLGLPQPAWLDPYAGNIGTKYPSGYPSCSKPTQLVISDINPSFDTDQVPGSTFNGGFSGDLNGFNAATQADLAWNGMGGTEQGEHTSESSVVFIGQSGSNVDRAPTAKTITGFSTIRGLAPENPGLEGGFSSTAAAIFGKTHDLNSVSGDQKVDNLSVVLASPLPKIVIPVPSGGTTRNVTLVPFAKTVGGCTSNGFAPTDQIVDFYVDTLANIGGAIDASVNGGRPYGRFRINYEDVEFGADHDMDAIVQYTVALNADNTVSVNLVSDYAAGGCIQHMGYVISGTTRDGTYLEVRDSDTAAGSDPDYALDTPPDQLPGGTYNDAQPLPLTASRSFSVGTSGGASLLKHDPLWYAAKWGGFYDRKDEVTHQGNDKLDLGEWDASPPSSAEGLPAGDGVPDNYFLVTNAGQLKEQLSKAFRKIQENKGSASAVSANSSRLDAGTVVFQAKFSTNDWTGSLLAFQLEDDGSTRDRNGDGRIDDNDAVWNAADQIPAAGSRKIFSFNPDASGSKGIEFLWGKLTSNQQTKLVSEDIVNYLRGDTSKEGKPFRKRASRLGDIVNSDPWFAGAESFGYQSLPEGASSNAYQNFLNSKRTRDRMLYVGANDGMLHGFLAGTYASGSGTFSLGSGTERFAYFPNALFGSPLTSLADPTYQHRYFMDGAPRVGDAYFDGAWRSVLVGSTGAGGRAVFALDVTNPASFSETKVLWEFTSANDTDLGYTLPQASIGRMHDGSWAAVVANGYNSDSGKAVLFVINLQTGAVIRKLDTLAAGNASVAKNGLSTPVIVDADNDRIIDYAYAGDLLGNLWKFDLKGGTAASWKVAYDSDTAPQPLFVACTASTNAGCTAANRQPITAKPLVSRSGGEQDRGMMVYVGTGRYFEEGDNIIGSSPQVQTFYGLWDRNTGTAGTDQISGTIRGTSGGLLTNQTIDAEVSRGKFDLRVTSANGVNYTTQRGWLLDLKTPPSPGTTQGERVVSFAQIRAGRVIFTTLVPLADPCEFGGTGWLMELNALTGARSGNASPIWDVGGAESGSGPDGKIDANDLVNSGSAQYVASGRKSNVGIIKTPAFVSRADGKTAIEHTSGSSGSRESGLASDAGGRGRQGWTQLH